MFIPLVLALYAGSFTGYEIVTHPPALAYYSTPVQRHHHPWLSMYREKPIKQSKEAAS